MKSKLLVTMLASLALSPASFAASYIFNNGSGANGYGIVDTTGNPFRSGTTPGQAMTATGDFGNWTSAGTGVIAIGFFSEDPTADMGVVDLLARFTVYGAPATFGAGPGGARGMFSYSAPATAIGGSEFDGKNMFLFAGNGTTLGESTSFLVLKHNSKFSGADDSVPTAITLTFSPATISQVGSLYTPVANVPTTNTDSTVTSGFMMIPEPSVSLLGALGVFGLLRRRR